MADQLVQEAANEAREVFRRRLIRLHDHGETDAVVTMRNLEIQSGHPSRLRERKEDSWLG
jgi:hypothetical protein